MLPWLAELIILLNAATAWCSRAFPFSQLSPAELSLLVVSPDPIKNLDWANPKSHLAKVLIPRAPGTENNTFVRNYMAATLRALNWHIHEDMFTDSTPYGVKTFVNLIATKDPAASRRLILSAHFDSKFFPTAPLNQFVGATDSAAPCAILLDIAEALNPLLERQQFSSQGAADTTLQLVFFDGEEAFKDWTSTDSIYGSRHLANKWATSYLPPHPSRRLHPGATEISTIEHLVLLDLLGARDPLVRSYFPSTAWLFDALVSAEHRLGDAGIFDDYVPNNTDQGKKWQTSSSFFVPRTNYDTYISYIQDDHVPFLSHGVNILHVIASPFPRVWHTLEDDASALDLPTLKRWALIFRLFTAEYLGLQPYLVLPRKVRSNEDLA